MGIVLMTPYDFSGLRNFTTKTHAWKSHAVLAVDFTTKEMWPLNSSELNPFYYYVWVMLEVFHRQGPKPKTSPNSRKCCKWRS